MSDFCDYDRPGHGKRGCSSGRENSGILFFRSGGDCLWDPENEDHLHLLFSVRYNGCTGRQYSWNRICGDADDRFSSGRLRLSCCLDLYDLSMGEDIAYALHFLSGFMDADGTGAFDMLCCGPKKAGE